MRTVRNFAFALLVTVVVFAANKQVFAMDTWQAWAAAHGCDMIDWYPGWAYLSGYCDCGGGMGCEGDSEFCSSFEGACFNYCLMYSCGYAEVSACDPQLIGNVECSCDYCNR